MEHKDREREATEPYPYFAFEQFTHPRTGSESINQNNRNKDNHLRCVDAAFNHNDTVKQKRQDG